MVTVKLTMDIGVADTATIEDMEKLIGDIRDYTFGKLMVCMVAPQSATIDTHRMYQMRMMREYEDRHHVCETEHCDGGCGKEDDVVFEQNAASADRMLEAIQDAVGGPPIVGGIDYGRNEDDQT